MNLNNYETLLTEKSGRALIVTINRPDKANALSEKSFLELRDLFDQIAASRGLFAGVCITGKGDKAFAAGADIAAMNAMSSQQGEDFSALAQSVTLQIEALPVPVIACVNGYAFGGGCELALSCDFIYATHASEFGQPEVNLGLIPGFGGCVRLARCIGLGLARELIYTGRRMKADEAVKAGLVNRVFENKLLMLESALETIKVIGTKSSSAVALCKRTIQTTEAQSIEAGLLSERRSFRAAFESPHKSEGVRAFIEKRKAIFS